MRQEPPQEPQNADRTDSWAVTIERNGDEVVTLSSNGYGGRDISAADGAVIETAAMHLLSFIGKSATLTRETPALPPPLLTVERPGSIYSERQMQHAKIQARSEGHTAARAQIFAFLGLDPLRIDDDEFNALIAKLEAAARG